MQSVENFKKLESTSISSNCLPAVRSTNTKSMASDVSRNKGNLQNCNEDLYAFSFHPSLFVKLHCMREILKEGDRGVAPSTYVCTYYVTQTTTCYNSQYIHHYYY